MISCSTIYFNAILILVGLYCGSIALCMFKFMFMFKEFLMKRIFLSLATVFCLVFVMSFCAYACENVHANSVGTDTVAAGAPPPPPKQQYNKSCFHRGCTCNDRCKCCREGRCNARCKCAKRCRACREADQRDRQNVGRSEDRRDSNPPPHPVR